MQREDSVENKEVKTVTVMGFGRRLAANLIDIMFIWVFGLLLGTAVGVAGLLLDMFTPNRPMPLNALIIASGLIFSVVYYVAAWAKAGQTIGKMTLGIKVVGADGNPPSWGAAFLRYIGYIVNVIVFSLGFLWIVFDGKRQGWHDKLAGTYVVYVEDRFTQVDAVKLVPAEGERRWIWVLLWALLAISVPGALVGVWALGPYVGQGITTLLSGLR
jgi:uncharacterized RDD family membrane protein YckC